jgi:hypothetical protein
MGPSWDKKDEETYEKEARLVQFYLQPAGGGLRLHRFQHCDTAEEEAGVQPPVN